MDPADSARNRADALVKRITSFVKIKSRLFILYSYDRQNKVSDTNIPVFRALSQRYQIRIIQDLEELSEVDCTTTPIVGPDTIAHFRECVKNGGYIFLVFDDVRLIFRCCVQKGPYECRILGNSYLRIPVGAYCIECAETDVHYQRQKIYQWILFEICQKLNEKVIYIGTDIENVSSQKGIERAGFVKKELLSILRWGFLTKVLNKINYSGEGLLQ